MLIADHCGWHRRASCTSYQLALLLGSIVTIGIGCGASGATSSRAASQPTAPTVAPSERSQASLAERQRPTPVSQAAKTDQALAEEATLSEVLAVALARNPELAEARDLLRAARESAPAASRLPDPELEYQLWAQPLAKPYALGEAQMHMFGLRQTFPAPGSLAAQYHAALAKASVASEAGRAREQDLIQRVRQAFAEYYRTEREYRIHLDHARLAQQILDLVRAAYQGARGSQQDVLRAAVVISRLHTDVAAIDRDRRTARGLLNTLMARAPEAPLGPPRALEPPTEQRFLELDQVIADRRPEIAAAESAILAREGELDASRASARWPAFMVGLQYMYMPPESERHNYGVMFSMNLPWLNPRHAEEVRAAEARLGAQKSALASSRQAARYELYEAIERLRAARASFIIIERDLVPLAQQNFESAETAYRGGRADALGMLDALSSVLDVRLERERALVRVHTALADLERAGGVRPFFHPDMERLK